MDHLLDNTLSYDLDQTKQHVDKLTSLSNTDFIEVRMTGNRLHENKRFHFPQVGLFDDFEALAKVIKEYSGHTNIYTSINPRVELIRHSMPINRCASGISAASDKHVAWASSFYVDEDTETPIANISATKEEVMRSYELHRAVRGYFVQKSIPFDDVFTGNGFSLDLYHHPITDTEGHAGALKLLYKFLARKFDREGAHIDKSVHNPSRIKKLIGTKAVKGNPTEKRPHRLAQYIECEKISKNDLFDFYKVFNEEIEEQRKYELGSKGAKKTPPVSKSSRSSRVQENKPRWTGDFTCLDLAEILRKAKINYEERHDKLIVSCPWEDEHSTGHSMDSSTALIFEDGKIKGFKCFHNSHISYGIREYLYTLREYLPEPENAPDTETSKGDFWAPPRSPETPLAGVFPVSALPPILRDLVNSISRHLQVPPVGVFLVFTGVISAVLRGRWSISITNSYKEALILWTMWVARSGVRKSPVWTLALEPVQKWEAEQTKHAEEKNVEIRSQIKTQEARVNDLRKQYARGKQSKEKLKNIAEEISSIEKSMPVLQMPKRIYGMDFTPEAVPLALKNNNGSIGILSDEGGILAAFQGRYSTSGSDLNIDALLQGYSQTGNIKVDRVKDKGVPTIVERPSITVAFSPQPSVISENRMNRLLRGKGLPARFLTAYSDGNLGNRSFIDEDLPTHTLDTYKELISTLIRLGDRLIKEEERKKMKLTDEAKHHWTKYFDKIEASLGEGGKLRAYTDYGAKWPAQAIRLAGLFSVLSSKGESTSVTKSDIENAITVCEYLLPHGIKLLEEMEGITSEDTSDKVENYLLQKSGNSFTKSEFYNKFRSTLKTSTNINAVLEKYIRSNWIKRKVIHTKRKGKPLNRFHVNPLL